MTLRERVERALAEQPTESGVTVFGPDLRVLAERDPLPGGGQRAVYLRDRQEPRAWRP